jgi:hypothetical protein
MVSTVWATRTVDNQPQGGTARKDMETGQYRVSASTRADPRRFAGSSLFFAPVIQLHKKREHLGR